MRRRHWRTSKASGAGSRSPTTGNFRVTCCRGGTRGVLTASLSFVCAIVALYPDSPRQTGGGTAYRNGPSQFGWVTSRAQPLALALHANAFTEVRHWTLTAHG